MLQEQEATVNSASCPVDVLPLSLESQRNFTHGGSTRFCRQRLVAVWAHRHAISVLYSLPFRAEADRIGRALHTRCHMDHRAKTYAEESLRWRTSPSCISISG